MHRARLTRVTRPAPNLQASPPRPAPSLQASPPSHDPSLRPSPPSTEHRPTRGYLVRCLRYTLQFLAAFYSIGTAEYTSLLLNQWLLSRYCITNSSANRTDAAVYLGNCRVKRYFVSRIVTNEVTRAPVLGVIEKYANSQ